jgi:hypothetical protein
MHSNWKFDEPRHWDLLDYDDKGIYLRICAVLSAPTNRNRRNKRIEDFRAIIDAIEVFQNSDVENKWRRCLVCGLCRLRNGIAVNTTQLKRLVFKCKSSINESLKRLGYGIITTDPSASDEFLEEIPYLKDNATEFRRWTIRTNGTTYESDVDDDDATQWAAPELKKESTIDSDMNNPQYPSYNDGLHNFGDNECIF